MRIVLDTNILISALGWEGNEYHLFQQCVRGELTLILSLEIVEEFKKVASRQKFGFTPSEIDDFLSVLFEVSELSPLRNSK